MARAVGKRYDFVTKDEVGRYVELQLRKERTVRAELAKRIAQLENRWYERLARRLTDCFRSRPRRAPGNPLDTAPWVPSLPTSPPRLADLPEPETLGDPEE
jgi:hypothetical protein